MECSPIRWLPPTSPLEQATTRLAARRMRSTTRNRRRAASLCADGPVFPADPRATGGATYELEQHPKRVRPAGTHSVARERARWLESPIPGTLPWRHRAGARTRQRTTCAGDERDAAGNVLHAR